MRPRESKCPGEVWYFGNGYELGAGSFVLGTVRKFGKRRTLGLGDKFSRRCLENVPLEVEARIRAMLDLEKPRPCRAVRSSANRFQEPLAIGGADLAALLKLDDAATDLPVSGRKDGVDGLCGRMACSVEQLGDPREDLVIARGAFGGGW